MDPSIFEVSNFANTIKEIAGDKFISKLNESSDGRQWYQLYCFNDKYWTTSDFPLRSFIDTHLFNYYKALIDDANIPLSEYKKCLNKISKLQKLSTIKKIIKIYKQVGINNNIEFDTKWWLLGFNNKVYDLKLNEFRNYKLDDYISITTNYNWVEPDINCINEVKNLLIKNIPNNNDRTKLLKAYTSCLEGNQCKKITVLNSNVYYKNFMNDILMKALGEYGEYAECDLLFTKRVSLLKKGFSNLNKKRFILFRNLVKNRIKNDVPKVLIGDDDVLSKYNDDNSPIILNNSAFIECCDNNLFFEGKIKNDLDIFTIIECKTFPNTEVYVEDRYKYGLMRILLDEYKKQNTDSE